jgi:hypothetical protein
MDSRFIAERVTLQIKQGTEKQNRRLIALAMFLVQREIERGRER